MTGTPLVGRDTPEHNIPDQDVAEAGEPFHDIPNDVSPDNNIIRDNDNDPNDEHIENNVSDSDNSDHEKVFADHTRSVCADQPETLQIALTSKLSPRLLTWG